MILGQYHTQIGHLQVHIEKKVALVALSVGDPVFSLVKCVFKVAFKVAQTGTRGFKGQKFLQTRGLPPSP